MSVLNSGKFSTIRTLNTPFFPLFLGFPLGICYNSFIASQFWIFFLALPIFNSLFFSLCISDVEVSTDISSNSLTFFPQSAEADSASEAVYFSPQTQKQSTFLLRLRSSLLSPQTQKQSTSESIRAISVTG